MIQIFYFLLNKYLLFSLLYLYNLIAGSVGSIPPVKITEKAIKQKVDVKAIRS
jgi:hypothetical protein